MWTDPLLRALRADPAVFRPVYRVHKLMLGRRARLVRRRGKGVSSFALLCCTALVWGLMAMGSVLSGTALMGGGLAVSLGAGFLLMVVLTDDADSLVHPADHLVLAAHPHDDRSLLLAKLAAIGRSLALLSAFLFLPAGLALVFARGPGAGLAFLAGAAGAAIAVAAGGLLFAVLLVRLWGRQKMERLLSWIQGFFWISYLLLGSGSSRWSSRLASGLPPRATEVGVWLWPAFWFNAPFELATGGASGPALGRLALAGGSLVLLVAAFRRLAMGLGTRLLEPEPRLAARRSAAAPVAGGRLSFLLPFEGLRLLTLLRVQLRADWRARSEFLYTPLLALFMIYRYAKADDPAGGAMVVFFLGWLLFLSTDTLTRSPRPASLWWLLAGPVDRARFSFATVPLLRLFLLAPVALAITLLGLRAQVPWQQRLPLLFEVIVYGDLMLLFGKVVFPQFPFSLPSRREGGAGGARLMAALGGGLVSGAGLGLVLLSRHFGTGGVLAGLLLFLLLHPPVALWARRRTAGAVAGLEIAELE